MGERGSSAQWEGTRRTLLFLHTCTPNNYGGAAHCAQEHGGSSGLELAAMPWAAAVLERMVNQNLHHDVIMDFKASPARPGDGCRICVHAKQGLHRAKSVWRGLATQKGWLLPGCLLALPWLSAAQHPLAPPRTRLGSHTHPTNTHTHSLSLSLPLAVLGRPRGQRAGAGGHAAAALGVQQHCGQAPPGHGPLLEPAVL